MPVRVATIPTVHDRRSAPLRLLSVALVVAAGVAVLSAQDRARVGDEERTLAHGGRQRTYLVHDFGRGQPAPVVVVLHGGGGNAANAVRMTGFDRVGAREGLVVVYPNGTAGRDRGTLRTWNAGHCCAAAMRNRVDDVGFVGAIIDALVASGRADPSRVYVTGMSNGGMMAHRLGRELSGRIAAIAPVVGAVFGDEPAPQAAMPAFIVVGADDTTVPASGGSLRLRRAVRPRFARRPRRGAGDGPGHLLGTAQRLRRSDPQREPHDSDVGVDRLPQRRSSGLPQREGERPRLAGWRGGPARRRDADDGVRRDRRDVGVLRPAPPQPRRPVSRRAVQRPTRRCRCSG